MGRLGWAAKVYVKKGLCAFFLSLNCDFLFLEGFGTQILGIGNGVGKQGRGNQPPRYGNSVSTLGATRFLRPPNAGISRRRAESAKICGFLRENLRFWRSLSPQFCPLGRALRCVLLINIIQH